MAMMNLEDIGTQLMYTTAPIYALRNDKSISAGTSFMFSVNQTENTSIPLLITNYHVVKDSIGGYVELHIAKKGIPSNEVVKVQFDKTVLEPNKLGELDLVALPLAGAINDMQGKGKQIFFKSIDCNLLPKSKDIEEFSAIEEITFIGYPSAIYDWYMMRISFQSMSLISEKEMILSSVLVFIRIASISTLRTVPLTVRYCPPQPYQSFSGSAQGEKYVIVTVGLFCLASLPFAVREWRWQNFWFSSSTSPSLSRRFSS